MQVCYFETDDTKRPSKLTRGMADAGRPPTTASGLRGAPFAAWSEEDAAIGGYDPR